MNKKIIIFDIIVMVLIILLPFIFFYTSLFNVNYIIYNLFIMYLYTFIKSIFGVIIIINKRCKKVKIINSKKNILYLFPMMVLALSYIYLILNVIKDINDILLFFTIILDKGFITWFSSMNANILLSIVIIIGILMWLINWIFYEENIKKII